MAVLGLELPLLLVLAGVGLMILEALSPTEYFMILGVALLLAGLVGVGVPALAGPLALAVLTFGFGAVAFYVYSQYDVYGDGNAGQTRDSASLRGATGTVVEPVTSSEGRVKLDDGGFNPFYQARALDGEIPEGEEVIVVDPGGGNVLTVTGRDAVHRDEIDRELEREAARSERSAGAGRDDPDDPTEPGQSADDPTGAAEEPPHEPAETDLESERSD